MMLPVLLVFSCATLAESLYAGESCSLANGDPGVCSLLTNCQPVKQQLIIGNVPDNVCGYSGLEPIVCCPPSAPQKLTGDGRGAISREKCAEYSQSVWVSKQTPLLLGDSKRINVSECAITTQNLIIPGPMARPGEFPHMAAVGFDSRDGDIHWACSGTLISETFVLTAAHCTKSWQSGNATWVRLGDLSLKRSDDGVQPEDRRIVETIKHPDFKHPSQYHDIALLRLETRVPFNRWIRPACLYTAPSVTEGSKAIVTGWGGVEPNAFAEDPHVLVKIVLSFLDSKSCNTSWGTGKLDKKLPNGVVEDWMMCAAAPGRDTCQGDTGGPLAIMSKTYCMWDIVGVTSQGNVCGSGLPGIYTRVYNYIPWIESIVWSQR